MALQQAGLEWINQNLDGFLGGIDRGNRAMGDTGGAADGAAGRLNILSGVVMGVASSVTTFLLDAFSKASKAVLGLVTDSIGLATNFESMATRLKIAGTGAATQAGIALSDLSEAAIKVGGDTRLMGVSATGAADAITDLLKAGLSVDDVMGDFNAYMKEGAKLGGVLGASIGLASASELNMVEASNLASTSMTIFGLSAGDVEKAMDYIVRGADSSVASVTDIRDALEGAGPTLRGFGFSIEDSVDALSLLSNAGIKGAEAGTALRSAFTQMTSNKAKVIAAFAEQGVSVTNAAGDFVSFKEILGQLEIATEDMTEAQRAEFLQTIAGTYGKTALTALINQGTVAYDKYSVSLQNAAGIQTQATENAKTLAAADEALQGNIETLRIQIGSAFLPTLTLFKRGLAEVVDFIGPVMSPILDVAGKALTGLATRFSETALGGIELGALGDKIGGALKDFFWMIDVGVDPLKALKMALTAAFGQDVADKVVGVVTQVIDVVTGIKEKFAIVKTWVENNWPVIQTVIQTVFETIEKVIASVVAAIGPKIKSLIDRFKEMDPANVAAGFKTLWNIIKVGAKIVGGILVTWYGLVSSAFSGIVSLVESVIGTWEKMMEAFRSGDIVGGLLAAFTGVFEALWAFISGFATGFIDFFSNLLGVDIAGVWTTNWKMLVTIVETVWANIVTAITTWWDTLVGAVTGWFTDLETTWQTNWANLIITVKNVWTGIKNTIDEWMDNIFASMGLNFDDLKVRWKAIWDGIAAIVSEVWDRIKTAISDKFTEIRENVNTKLAEISAFWTETWDGIKTKITEIWNTVSTYISTKATEIKTFLQDEILTPLQMFWNTTWEAISAKITEIWDGIVAIVGPKIQQVFDAFTIGIDKIKTWISDKVGEFETAGANLLLGMRDGILGAIGGVIESITGGLENVIQAAKDKLGIHSRSKVFSEIGSYSMQGFINGLEEVKTKNALDVWDDLWDNVAKITKAAWATTVALVKAGFQNMINIIVSYSQQFIQKGRDLVTWITTGFVEAWVQLIETVHKKIDEIIQAISDNYESLYAVGAEIVRYITLGIIAAWDSDTGIPASIRGKLISLKTDIGTAFGNVKGVGNEIAYKIKDGIAEAWYTVVDWLGDKLSGTGLDSIWDIVSKAGTEISDAGAAIVDFIIGGIQKAWGGFVEWLLGAVGDIFGNMGGGGGDDDGKPRPKPVSKLFNQTMGQTFVQAVQRGMAELLPSFHMGSEGMPVLPSQIIRDVSNTRSIVVEVNPTYAGYQSEADIYFDIAAALAGARI